MIKKNIILGEYINVNISPNQIITINRGDTFNAPLFINIGGSKIYPVRYPFTDKDTIYVGIMEAHQPFEHAIIKKVYTIEDLNEYGDIVLRLDSKDTEYLLPGTYYYEIKLEHINDDDTTIIKTIVPKRKLFLVE